MTFRALFADELPDLQYAQLANDPGTEHQRKQQSGDACQRGTHRNVTKYVERLGDALHLYSARTLYEHQVPRSKKVCNESRCFSGGTDKFCALGRVPGSDGAADKAFGVTLHPDDPVDASRSRGRAYCLAVQLAGGMSQFKHLAGGENAP